MDPVASKQTSVKSRKMANNPNPGPSNQSIQTPETYVREGRRLFDKTVNNNAQLVTLVSVDSQLRELPPPPPPKLKERKAIRMRDTSSYEPQECTPEDTEIYSDVVPPTNEGNGFEVDGIQVTVHAPEEEFPDSEIEEGEVSEIDDLEQSFYQSEENGSEVGTEVVLSQVMSEGSPSVGPGFNSEEDAEKFLASNPYLGSLFKRMIKDSIAEESKQLMTPPQTVNNTSGWSLLKQKGKPQSLLINQIGNGNRNQGVRSNTLIKSSSDTTLYAPALNKVNNNKGQNSLIGGNEVIINKITDFVEGIRLENQVEASTSSNGTRGRDLTFQTTPTSRRGEEATANQYTTAQNLVVKAKKFKATVESPKGKCIDLIDQVLTEQGNSTVNVMDDDEFFHLTCHVDISLKQKIERSEFIELERLLPKKKSFKDENRLEWVSHEGMTFFAPVQDREFRITNIHKWDQAFRIYAAIYCNANPSRSGEIWQYIYTINSAAVTYQWDNVSYYDTTFRQMMSERPKRSWAKTYTQLWQLALQDPIQKNAQGS